MPDAKAGLAAAGENLPSPLQKNEVYLPTAAGTSYGETNLNREQTSMSDTETETERFRDLLRDFDTAVLLTHAKEEDLTVRPMVVAKVDDNCDLWFITSIDSAKVREIRDDGRVQVVCQEGWESCVSIAGRASVVDDRAKIHELWKKSYQVWFPKGADDPDAVLIRVRGDHGEYWDNTGTNRLVYAYQAVKAVITGTKPEYNESGDQHGEVDLSGHR
ncbi:MAG: pyridoxamine 5'-phosphate oxidase family protein [Gemmatimonadota bacterium]